jgi:hypothetical protein
MAGSAIKRFDHDGREGKHFRRQENWTGLVLNTNTFGKVERPMPTCGRYDSGFSKFYSALLKGIDIRNIPRHLAMILPNIGSLRL